MARLTALSDFYDLKAHVWRRAGDTFDATEGRASQILGTLPGAITYVTEAKPDLTSMTVAELKALASERGVELPKRASKATILKILEG